MQGPFGRPCLIGDRPRGDSVTGQTGGIVRQPIRAMRFLGFIPVAVWLFTQMVMIAAWSPGVSAAPALAGQAVVICTGDGLVTVYFDADGNPIEQDGKPAQPCPWCTSFSGPPTLTEEIQPAAVELRLVDFVYSGQSISLWESGCVASGFSIRAPPVKA